MSIEKIITNDEFKIVFLKAIILGINYGKKDESEKYKNSIENEILSATEKLHSNSSDSMDNLEMADEVVKEKSIQNNVRVNNIVQNNIASNNIASNNISSKYISNNVPNNFVNTNFNNMNNIIEYNITKHQNTINTLESQKNSIYYLIENLSKTNYSFNYSKINLLKNSINSLNNEINKTHIIIMREKVQQKTLFKSYNQNFSSYKR